MYLLQLDKNVVHSMLAMLDVKSLMQMRSTCKYLHTLIEQSPALWTKVVVILLLVFVTTSQNSKA